MMTDLIISGTMKRFTVFYFLLFTFTRTCVHDSIWSAAIREYAQNSFHFTDQKFESINTPFTAIERMKQTDAIRSSLSNTRRPKTKKIDAQTRETRMVSILKAIYLLLSIWKS